MLNGEGARLTGGRWNSKGVPVVYLASSLALAALELLIHIDYARALQDHVAIPLTFPRDLVLEVDRQTLPYDWTTPLHLGATQAIGDAWVKQRASAILAVPSVVVPTEPNYLFNPNHPDAERTEVGEVQLFGTIPAFSNQADLEESDSRVYEQ